jgi:uncharacterized protein YcbX
MTGAIAALFRHPIKGFTPEKLERAHLATGQPFPGDRMFAVEDGPSGFDPKAPGFIPKQKFAVLAKSAAVARVRTAYDDRSGTLRASAAGAPDIAARLTEPKGRDAFAAWLTGVLGEDGAGPYRVIDGRGHHFLDHPQGHVSIVSLASVRDLAARLGAPVDPLRFRANLYVEGWSAWAENAWSGRALRLGDARARVFKPITRCAAPDVDPATAKRDLEITAALHRFYGHLLCGVYVRVEAPGMVAAGDVAELQSL